MNEFIHVVLSHFRIAGPAERAPYQLQRLEFIRSTVMKPVDPDKEKHDKL